MLATSRVKPTHTVRRESSNPIRCSSSGHAHLAQPHRVRSQQRHAQKPAAAAAAASRGSSSASSSSRSSSWVPAVRRPAAGCAAAAAARGRRATRHVCASLMVKDSSTGVEFPVAQQFWEGDAFFRSLGVATHTKRAFIMTTKLYTLTAYVEAARCAKELGIRQRGGFFESDDDYCQAIMDGAFSKAIVIRVVKDMEGQALAEPLQTSLAPRMSLSGEGSKLQELLSVFSGRKLKSGSEVVLLWSLVGDMEVVVSAPGDVPRAYHTVKPDLRIRSPGLCRGLFEAFLGGSPLVPAARTAWAAGARNLLESDNVNRSARKGGSG